MWWNKSESWWIISRYDWYDIDIYIYVYKCIYIYVYIYIYIYAIRIYIVYIYIYNCVTVVLNYAALKKDPKLITKIKPFVKKYNLKGINFELEKYDWKNLKKIM